MSFTEESEVSPGYTMTFKDTFRIVSEGMMIKLTMPKLALRLTKRFRQVDLAFNELEVCFFSCLPFDALTRRGLETHAGHDQV